jgi:hypothetical protein
MEGIIRKDGVRRENVIGRAWESKLRSREEHPRHEGDSAECKRNDVINQRTEEPRNNLIKKKQKGDGTI